MIMSVNSVMCVPWDTCGNQWAAFKELVISFYLVSEVNSCFCTVSSSTAGLWVAGHISCLYLPSLCKTVGITDVYHYVHSFRPGL